MKTHERSFGIILGTTLLFFLSLLSSCADRDAPSPATAQKLLGTFFEEQGFKMVSLDLGEIEGAPLAQKGKGDNSHAKTALLRSGKKQAR